MNNPLENVNTNLLPDRHPENELFVCDVADAVLKDIMPQMEHPFYSLSKKPDTAIKRYEHNGNWLEVIPSVKGHATIYDKDILVYCISQLMEKLKCGEKVSRRVRVNSRDFLVFTNRGTGGKDYKALADSLIRLSGTQISTNIKISQEEEQQDVFSLIDSASLRRKHGLDGRLLWCEVQISDWVFNAIREKDVLTLHPDYFRLSKPLEKRIYEIARKHCGQQATWKIGIENLLKKTGSKSSLKKFKQLLKSLIATNHLPDYTIETQNENIVFTNINFNKMGSWYKPAFDAKTEFPKLKPETYNIARKVTPGFDVYYLEQEWQAYWYRQGRKQLDNPDGAFVAFCKGTVKNPVGLKSRHCDTEHTKPKINSPTCRKLKA